MAQKPSIPKGTRDFLPEVMLRREYIFDTIRSVFRKYGYAPIETPAMEQLSVLTGKYGEEGDRLIFKILNSGDFLKAATELNDATRLSYQICDRALRYDLTVPFARFVVMHQHELTFPFKRYQIQPVWRADRPQKGRYREFYQCDADVVGSDSLLFEGEFIAIFDEALSRLGLPGFNILVSNRKILSGYAEVVGQEDKFIDICVAIDKLDKIGKEGVQKELLGRGVSAEATTQILEMIAFAGSNEEKIAFLKDKFADSPTGLKGLAEMEEVFHLAAQLSHYRATVTLDLTLARGLEYYTGTIFEVKALGVSIGSIASGGRYDNLTGVFGVEGLSGVGISFGADRIYDVMEELGLFAERDSAPSQVLLVNFGPDTFLAALAVLNTLREKGIAAELYPDEAKMKKQFSYADKKGIPYTLMVGSEEVASQQYKVKNMRTGEQVSLPIDGVIGLLNA